MDYLKKMLSHKSPGEHCEIIQPDWEIATVASHLVAFLNSGGGTIIARFAEGSAKTLELELKANISPSALFSVTEDNYNDEDVFIIDVPGGKDLPFVYDGSIFLRKGNQTVKADAYDIQELLQRKAATPQRWERKVSLGLESRDLDSDRVDKLHSHINANSQAHSTNEMLTQMGFLRSDGQFTNAADVCLAQRPSIRHPQIRVRMFMFESPVADSFYDEMTLEGSINELIEESYGFIRRNTPTRSKFNDSIQRTSEKAYPESALREALVNALAHRDYSSHSGGVTIKLYPNELRIWNSGNLPDDWKSKDLTKEHPSIPRNPDIAQYLYLSKYMERIGRGTIKMIDACNAAHIPRPEWNLKHGVEVIFKLPQSLENISKDLNRRQMNLLESIPPGQTFTTKEYRDQHASEISQKQASRDLNELAQLGLLTKTGTGRGTKYLRT